MMLQMLSNRYNFIHKKEHGEGLFMKGISESDGKKLEAKKDVNDLIKTLKYKDSYYVRLRAVEALGKIGDARAVEPLIEVLKDEYEPIQRSAAAEALVNIGEPAVEPLIQAMKDSNNVLWKAVWILGKIGDARAAESLISAMEDNVDLRWKAAEALEEIGDARAIRPLILAMENNNINIRNKAVRVLGKIRDIRAVEPLIEALMDEDNIDDVGEAFRCAVAEALGKIGDLRAVEPLIEALKDYNEWVRWSAAEALENIGEPAVNPLIQALKDEDVSEIVEEVLENIKSNKN